MTNTYDNGSITSLKGEQKVRKRPAVFFGTNDSLGAYNAVKEIIDNAVDEAREGYGKQIRIKMYQNGTIEISDDGRGVPMDWNEAEKKWNWDLVYNTLYASGKYDASNYASSLGMNGLGCTITQQASEFMTVVSYKDNVKYCMQFKKGKPFGDLQKGVSDTPGKTGTTVKFKLDSEVFVGLDNRDTINDEFYIAKLRSKAMLYPGLEFVYSSEFSGNTTTIVYNAGIIDYIDSMDGKKLLNKTLYFSGADKGRDKEDTNATSDYEVTMEIGFNFSRDIQGLEVYHNTSLMSDVGTTNTAVTGGLTDAFTNYCLETGKLQKGDKFVASDILSIALIVASTNCPGHRTFFKNNTKSAINNSFIGKAFKSFIENSILAWLRSDKVLAERVCTEVLANKTAREEADKVSKKVVSQLSKSISGYANKPKKFVDCRTKDKSIREVYIVEGDSALGSCKLSRNADFQAIMPVRGKILNCLKEDLPRILSSDIIIDLLRVLGCGIEATNKHIDNLPKFDVEKLNFDKIIICTDADLDGMQIRCLVITMLYRLCPTLIKLGKVFIAETPLFEMAWKKETKFAFDEDEKNAILNEWYKQGAKDTQIKIQRSKGLGENDPEMMAISTMNPKTRRLIKVEYPVTGNDSSVVEIFNQLLGDDIVGRRMLVNKYFAETELSLD